VGRRELTSARALLDSLWRAIEPVELDEELVMRAGDLAEEHVLREYEAVHPASAEKVADEETFLVSADRELLAAATARGLATVALPAS
jgi:predicted nucleic acid-binding protein